MDSVKYSHKINNKLKTKQMEEKIQTSKGGSKVKVVLVLLLLILLAAAIAAAVYFYRQYNMIKADPNLIAQKETDVLKKSLSSIMEIPEEEPSIATVIDVEKIKDQQFFSKAQNGDKVIIYASAKQAILFRPSAKKIINVAPVSFESDQQALTSGEQKPEAQQ
jgi:hypothetical protein